MRNPLTCPHATERRIDSHVLCDLRETPTWVTCQTGLCGEPPACAFEEPDNSPEAVARRLAFMAGGAS